MSNSITEKKILTDDERQRLDNLLYKHRGSLRNQDGRNVLMISLIEHTGARSAELLLLKPSDIGDKSVTITAVKNSNNRTIPLPIELYRDLLEYVKIHEIKDNERLFPITTRQFRRVWDLFRPNKNKGLHSLRHSFGVALYRNCENVKSVQFALGHRQINNTEVYVSYVEGQKDLRQKMQGMFKRKK